MNPITQKAAFLCRVSHQQVSLCPVCIYIPVPKVAVQFLVLYKVQQIRRSKQNLKCFYRL